MILYLREYGFKALLCHVSDYKNDLITFTELKDFIYWL